MTSSLGAALTSYGTQKAIGELLLTIIRARGFVDGIGIRLPTIVRPPGSTNRAASGFFSSILREPFNGTRGGAAGGPATYATGSPRRAPPSASSSGRRRSTQRGSATGAHISVPGVSVTVGEEMSLIAPHRGDKAGRQVREVRDERSSASSPAGRGTFDDPPSRRPSASSPRRSFDDIIRVYIDDELDGRLRSQRNDHDRRRHRGRQRYRPSRRGGTRRRRVHCRRRRPPPRSGEEVHRPGRSTVRSPSSAMSPIRRRSTRCSTRSPTASAASTCCSTTPASAPPACRSRSSPSSSGAPSSTRLSPGRSYAPDTPSAS